MRLRSFAVWGLRIPFVEAFRHGSNDGSWCDSVIVRVEDDGGEVGYGEGTPRPFVTGETADSMMRHLADSLWPAVAGRELPDVRSPADLEGLAGFIPDAAIEGALSDNASRCALETAILDCALRRHNRGLAQVLPPARQRVVYSGVITAGPLEKALAQARQMKTIGLRQIKIKVGSEGKKSDIDRVRAIREIFGTDVSLRIDANGAWDARQALDILWALAPYQIASVEQPLERGPVEELREFKRLAPIPIMVDESLVTLADARELIAAQAVDYFNIRISKCGGLSRAAAIARMAEEAGVGVQVGSQVGETAVLAAAGRHLAAHLENVAFVEGSFGTLLLSEDLSPDGIRFGHKGEAPVLTGHGLGVRILEDRLHKYAVKQVSLVAPHAAPPQGASGPVLSIPESPDIDPGHLDGGSGLRLSPFFQALD